MCYSVGPCWLPVLNIVYICQSQTPNSFLPCHRSPLVTISFFSKSVSLFLFFKFNCIIFYKILHKSHIIRYLPCKVSTEHLLYAQRWSRHWKKLTWNFKHKLHSPWRGITLWKRSYLSIYKTTRSENTGYRYILLYIVCKCITYTYI